MVRQGRVATRESSPKRQTNMSGSRKKLQKQGRSREKGKKSKNSKTQGKAGTLDTRYEDMSAHVVAWFQTLKCYLHLNSAAIIRLPKTPRPMRTRANNLIGSLEYDAGE